MGQWIEKWCGFLLAAAGLVWAGYHTVHYAAFDAAFLRLGPMQALMLGLMLWLHGKFRDTAAANSLRH